MYENYIKLKKPIVQWLNIFMLVSILFSFIAYFNGLTINKTPFYLIITTIIEIVIIISGFLMLLFPNVPSSYENLKKNSKIFMTIGFLSSYGFIFSFYNIYYFMAAEIDVNLTKFWIVNLVFMLISFSSHILSLILLSYSPKFIKNKTSLVMVLKLLVYLIYIQKILEYFMIPNILDSHFMLVIVIVIILISNFLFTQLYMFYIESISKVEIKKA